MLTVAKGVAAAIAVIKSDGDDFGAGQSGGGKHARNAHQQKRFHALADVHILGGKQRPAKPNPPDVLTVKKHPPRNKVQRTGKEQAFSVIFCAQQNLDGKAHSNYVVQHIRNNGNKHRPCKVCIAVTEGNDVFVTAQPQKKGNVTDFQARCSLPCSE